MDSWTAQLRNRDVEHIDQICDRFEAAWKAGTHPRADVYLDEASKSARGALLKCLVAIELEYRQKQGMPASVESLLAKYPKLEKELTDTILRMVSPNTGNTSLRNTESDIGVVDGVPRTRDSASKLRMSCPHCRATVEVLVDTPLAFIPCTACGESFCLMGDDNESQSAVSITRMGHFELLERLGIGGFGTVWKARDTRLDRTVAVKIPRTELLHPADIEQFMREAKTAAQLRHPNIVAVHEIGKENGTFFIVSDFVRGVPLSEYLTAHQPALNETVRLCRRIAEALHYAHEQGIVHRDLKPANIMIDYGGEPYIMDFGLARREVDEVTLTIDGKVMGTPAYMSPEQALGEGHRADRRSDIYALGVILFELLTGELPFRGSVRMLIHQVVNDEPPSPRKLSAHIPRDLETVCLKCMEKKPAQRYSTAGDLAKELRLVQEGKPITARPVGRSQRIWRWCNRNPVIAGLTISTCALLVVASALSTIAYFYADRDREQARIYAMQQARLVEREQDARQDVDDAYRSLESAYIDFAVKVERPLEAALWFANAAGLKGLGESRRVSNLLRAKAWAKLSPVPIAAIVHPSKHIMKCVNFHPTSNRYVLTADSGDSWIVWDLATEAHHEISESFPNACSMAWSPDGESLAVASQNQVSIHDFPSGNVRETITHQGRITELSFSSDGKYLAMAHTGVRIWDSKEHRFVTHHIDHRARVHAVRFHLDGRKFLTASADGNVRVFNVEKKVDMKHLSFPHHLHLATTYGLTPCSPHFLPNSEGILTSRHDFMQIFSLQHQGRLSEIRCGPVNVFTVSRDGRFLATGHDELARIWNLTTGHAVSAFRQVGAVASLSISPDGSVVATGTNGRSVSLWSLSNAQQLATELEHEASVHVVSFSHDGRFLASAQQGGGIRIWRIPVFSRWHRRLPVSHWGASVKLSPDQDSVLVTGTSFRSSGTTTLQVYDSDNSDPIGTKMRPGGRVVDADFSPDSATILTVSVANLPRQESGRLSSLQFWDWQTGKRLQQPTNIAGVAREVAFRPNGAELAVITATGRVDVIESNGGNVKFSFEVNQDYGADNHWLSNGALRYAAEGDSILIWGGSEIDGKGAVRPDAVYVFEADTGQLRYPPLQHDAKIFEVSELPSRRIIASCSFDSTVRLWSLDTGEAICDPIEHPDYVFNARFSADGNYLLTSCRDRYARLWDWQSGQMIGPTFRHDDEVFDAVFIPNTPWIATCGKDGQLRIWDAETGDLAMPPLKLSHAAQRITLANTQQNLFVASLSEIGVFSLAELVQDSQVLPQLGDSQIQYEILSGKRLHQRRLVKLTSDEWFARWNTFAQVRAKSDMSWEVGSELLWHKRQANYHIQKKSWDSALWHLSLAMSPKTNDFRDFSRRAELYVKTNQPQMAMADYKTAVRLAEGQGILGPREELADLQLKVGEAAEKAKRYEEAEAHFRAYLQNCERLVTQFPDDPVQRQKLALANYKLAKVLADGPQQNNSEAEMPSSGRSPIGR